MHPLWRPRNVLSGSDSLPVLLFSALPSHLNQLLLARLASTRTATSSSATAYPFPTHPRPTPSEIFHLRPGASPSEIKSRYFELVRIHHPDAPHARKLPPRVSHARFQAIKAAHDVLTGKTRTVDFGHAPSSGRPSSSGSRSRARPEHAHAHNGNAEWMHAASEAEATADDRWKDKIFMGIAAGTVGLAILPFLTSSALSEARHTSAAQNLAQARRDAREYGLLRRAAIRKRVRARELDEEYSAKVSGVEDRDGSHFRPD